MPTETPLASGQIRRLTASARTATGAVAHAGLVVQVVRRMAGPWWECRYAELETVILREKDLLEAEVAGV